MIAHLGMYDRPETAAANDRFWAGIRDALGHGPDALTRDGDFWEIWRSPDLLLSQTCGMPYRTKLHGEVALVGTPDYGLTGCPPGYYCSVFVAHRDRAGSALRDFDGQVFAYNEDLSQSGWAAPQTHMAAEGVRHGSLLQTGGHALSAQAVADRQADFAALDALTWDLIQEHDDFAKDLIELARTEPTPTVPFITALSHDAAPLRDAIRTAIQNLSEADRRLLRLQDLVEIPAETYLAIPTPPAPDSTV
jgi:ABC-type phosphate/phosphonate transport system substrate-binding protein